MANKVDKNKKTLVLLDSHAILHRAFHALPSFTSPTGEPTGALYGFISMIIKIIKEFNPDYLAACFDLPEPTFRHIAYDKYKIQRPKMDDALISQINKSKEVLKIMGVPVYELAGFEADDILATITELVVVGSKSKKEYKDLEVIIVTGDLDTLQLVQKGVGVYVMKKGISEAVLYDTKAVKERYGFVPELVPDFKGLRGDPSDNIIGVVGIGEKTAQKLIGEFGSIENLYKQIKRNEDAFVKIGITPRIINILKENEEEALFSKALAQVKKDVKIDFVLNDSVWDINKLDRKKIEEFFNLFSFKSLLSRINDYVDSGKKGEKNTPKKEQEKIIISEDDKNLEDRIKLAFWLVDSRKTNPKTEDILAHLRTNSLAGAEKILSDEMDKKNLTKLFNEIEVPLIPVLTKMEKRGVLLDVEYLKKLSKKYHKEIDLIENKIWKLSGEKFNISSPKQLSEVLFDKMGISSKGVRRTGQGTLSTRFSELEKIKDRHEIVEEIFRHRELSKLTSTYIDSLPTLIDKDNRVHTSFNQTGTTTGRLSSSDPNLQNIPIRSEFGNAVRRAFIVPKGKKLVSFDYSQVELRVAAFLSGDEKLTKVFYEGDDVHTRVAMEVFNVSKEKVTPEMRRRAKVINFGIIYGMGINSLKKNLECTKEEAQIFYDEYFHDFKEMADFMEKAKLSAKENGYTVTYFGRRRYVPEINSRLVFIRKEAERVAVNSPIQGTAADIIKIAMPKIDKFLVGDGLTQKAVMLLQVHDELLFEIDEDAVGDIVPKIKKIMENKCLGNMPLTVDVSIGDNWGQMDKLGI